MGDLRKVLVALIVIGTGLFFIGSLVERSATPHPETTEVSHSEEGEGHPEANEPGKVESASGTSGASELFGVDTESPWVIAVAVIASLALAAAVWLRPSLRWLLVLTAIVMLLFVVFDVREVVHQLDESRTGIAILAIVVGLIHLAASGVAGAMALGDGASRGKPSTVTN